MKTYTFWALIFKFITSSQIVFAITSVVCFCIQLENHQEHLMGTSSGLWQVGDENSSLENHWNFLRLACILRTSLRDFMKNKWAPTFRHHCKRSHLLPKLPCWFMIHFFKAEPFIVIKMRSSSKRNLLPSWSFY